MNNKIISVLLTLVFSVTLIISSFGNSSEINTLSFTDKISVELNNSYNQEFNKYEIIYSSDCYIKGEITYLCNNSEKTETIYLEKGNNLTFSSFIDDYISGGKGSNISNLTLYNLEENTCSFTLHSINGITATVYNDDVIYLENDCYKVGVKISMGGGISYIEDKKDNDDSITNLVNSYDTGRLVQQSYYGSESSPYVQENYNSTPWPYNPVQGGDQYGNKSKIVDLKVSSDSVYVKCLPLDWAKNNVPTQCYYENTYTLDNNFIRIDNRVLDYSGYTVTSGRHQELPAFYVISNLGTFTYYDGDKPWKNSSLITKNDLGFWGGSSSKNLFPLNRYNTETWCSWTNSSDYGIGIYVPNVDTLLAGRYQYDGSKSASSPSTNYVAPIRTLRFASFEPIEYSYLLTTGSVSEIRSNFTDKKDFAKNNTLDYFDTVKGSSSVDYTNIQYNSKDSLSTIISSNDSKFSLDEKGAKLIAKNMANGDPYVTISYKGSKTPVCADDYKYIVVTYLCPTTNSKNANRSQLFYCTGNTQNPSGKKSVSYDIKTDDAYHCQVLDMTSATEYSGDINSLRLDFFSAAVEENDTMYLKSIRLAKTLDEANEIAKNEVISSSTETTTEATTENIIYGDVDENGEITATDASLVLSYVLNSDLTPLTEKQLKKADVSGENSVTATDASQILSKVLNNDYSFASK